jgi:5-methylcytosine-specific restriction enzyme subunit McrC
LTTDEADALSALELAVVTPTRQPGMWDVAASSKIGVASVGDIQVTVQPKVDISRLVFLMGYALQPSFWRDHDVQLDPDADLLTAVADAYARLAVKALEQGLLHGYRTTDDTLPVLRGRLREGDQISRRLGIMNPLEVRYDEFTEDIAENQLLLAAAIRLLRLPGISASSRKALLRLRLQLSDVTLLVGGVQLPSWIPSRLNTRYQPALPFAEMILAGNSFEQRVGDLTVRGFVFDMWRIFEDFVCVALSEALRPFGGTSSMQHRMHLDEARDVAMRPDFTLSREGRVVLVADAKYKAERPQGFPQADLYQLLAYCTVLCTDEGHLVYAKGEEVPRRHRVAQSPVTIHCHTLDLEARPRELLAQVGRLAERMLKPAGLVAS